MISTNFDPNYGVYMNAGLKPLHVGVVCDCGAGYQNGDYTYKGSTTVYTRNGPVDLKLYNLKCDVHVNVRQPFLMKCQQKGYFSTPTKPVLETKLDGTLFPWFRRQKFLLQEFAQK